MQLKNVSVAKKVWLLVLTLSVLLLATSWGMSVYMASLEGQQRTLIQDLEGRMRLSVQLRGSIDIGGRTIVAANLAQDPQTRSSLTQEFRNVQKKNVQLMKELHARLSSEQGKALFQKLLVQIQKADTLIDSMQAKAQAGEPVDALVRMELIPVLNQFVSMLDELVELQQRILEEGLAQGDLQRTQAWWVALAVYAAVLLLTLGVALAFIRHLNAPLAQAVALADEIAQGNLSMQVEANRQDELGQLLQSLNAMTQSLRDVVAGVRQSVDTVSSAASQISSGNQDLSSRTEQTASNLEQTAASLEELTAAVTQSAENAHQAHKLVGHAAQAAGHGGKVMQQVVCTMEQIHQSSRRINDIIGVIDGIAFQTNILALNAAVEAARAGEQGRGFAVVAGEVRALAQRSANAAKEIKTLISASVSNVELGTEQVQTAGQSMEDIVNSVQHVSSLIAELSASTRQQRDGITQVNQAVNNLDQMTQQNAALVEESSAAAAAMDVQAQQLLERVSAFRLAALPASL